MSSSLTGRRALTGHLHAVVRQQSWQDNAGKNGKAAGWSHKFQLTVVGSIAAFCVGVLIFLLLKWFSGGAVPHIRLVAIGMSDYKQLSPHNCGKADAAFLNLVFGHLHDGDNKSIAPPTSVAGRLNKGKDLYDVIGSSLQAASRADAENTMAVIYISGHAVPLFGSSDASEPDIGLLALDTTVENLRDRDVSAYVRLTDICKLIDASTTRTVLLALDVDHPLTDWKTGILGDDVISVLKDMSDGDDSLLKDLLQSGRLVIICSRDVHQKSWPYFEESWETSTKTNFSIDNVSAFAYSLGEALTGRADGARDAAEADGRVSLGEICQYVKHNVNRWSEDHRAAAQTVLVFPEKVNPRRTGNLWENAVLKTKRGNVETSFLTQWAIHPPDNYEKWRELQELAATENKAANSPKADERTNVTATKNEPAKKTGKPKSGKPAADKEESIEQKLDKLWKIVLTDDTPYEHESRAKKQADIEELGELEHLIVYGMTTDDRVVRFLSRTSTSVPKSSPAESTLPMLAFQVCRKSFPTEETTAQYQQLLNGVSTNSPDPGAKAATSAEENQPNGQAAASRLTGVKVDDPAQFGRWLFEQAANATEPTQFNIIHDAIVSQWEEKNRTPPLELIMLKSVTRYYGNRASYESMTAALPVMQTWNKYLTVVSEVARSTQSDHFQLIRQDLGEATRSLLDGTRWLNAAAVLPVSTESNPLEVNAIRRFNKAALALDKCDSILEEVSSAQRLYRSTVIRFPSYASWVAAAAEQWDAAGDCDSDKLRSLGGILSQDNATLLTGEDLVSLDEVVDFRTKSDARMLKYQQLEVQFLKVFFRALNLRRTLNRYTDFESSRLPGEMLSELKAAKSELADSIADFEQTIRRPNTGSVSSNDYYHLLSRLVTMPVETESRSDLRNTLNDVPRTVEFSSSANRSQAPDRSGLWRAFYGIVALRLQTAALEAESDEDKLIREKFISEWLALYDASADTSHSQKLARRIDRLGSALAAEFVKTDSVEYTPDSSRSTDSAPVEGELMKLLSQYWYADHHLDDDALLSQVRTRTPQVRPVEWPSIIDVRASVSNDLAGSVSLKLTWPDGFEGKGDFETRIYGFPETSSQLAKKVDPSQAEEEFLFELRESLKKTELAVVVLTDGEDLCHFAPVVLTTPFDPNAWNVVFRNYDGQIVRREREQTSSNDFRMYLPAGVPFELSAFLDVPQTDTATKLVRAQLFACDDRSRLRERQPLTEPLEIQIGNPDQQNEHGEYRLDFVPRAAAPPAADTPQPPQAVNHDISNGFAIRLTPLTGETLQSRDAPVDIIIKCDYFPWTQWLKDPEIALQQENKGERIVMNVTPQPIPAQEKETVLLTPEQVLVELDDRKSKHLLFLAKRAELKLGDPAYQLIVDLLQPDEIGDRSRGEFDLSLTAANIPHACCWQFDLQKDPPYALKEKVTISRVGSNDSGLIVVTAKEGAFEELPLQMSIYANKKFKGEKLELKWFVEPYPLDDARADGSPHYIQSKTLNGPYDWRPTLSLAIDNKWTFQGTLSDFFATIESSELNRLRQGRYRLVCEVRQAGNRPLRDEKVLIVDNSLPEILKFDFAGVRTWKQPLQVKVSAKDDESGISRMRLILDKNGDGKFLDDDLTASSPVADSTAMVLDRDIELDLSELAERPGEYGVAFEIENGAGLPLLSSVQKLMVQAPTSPKPANGDGNEKERKGTLILKFDRFATIKYQLAGPNGVEATWDDLVTDERKLVLPAGKYVMTWTHSGKPKPDVEFEIEPDKIKNLEVRIR